MASYSGTLRRPGLEAVVDLRGHHAPAHGLDLHVEPATVAGPDRVVDHPDVPTPQRARAADPFRRPERPPRLRGGHADQDVVLHRPVGLALHLVDVAGR